MESASRAILPLPEEVIAQIKSSARITSLNGVILSLLSNSLDAGAVKFGPKTRMHGHNGAFLSSLAALSLVTITSHHHLHRSHNTLSLHRSKVIARLTPSPAHQHISFRHHGTRVTVRDLFGNMPVRVKQRALASAEQGSGEGEWEELKRDIVGVLLAEGRELTVVVRDAEKNKKFMIRPPSSSARAVSLETRDFCEIRAKKPPFDLPLTKSILSQASYIQRGIPDSWVPLSASTPYLSIHGAISLDPAPTKRVQFIAIGVNPVRIEGGNNVLFEEVNRLFAASGFGTVEDESDLDENEKERRLRDKRYKSDGYTNKQLKGGRKGVDRWPMFFLRIDFERQRGTHPEFGEYELMRDDSDLKSILELLGVATREFLMQNHFRPRTRRARPFTNSSMQSDEGFGRTEDEKIHLPDEETTRSPSPTQYHAGDDSSAKTRFILPRLPSSSTQTSSREGGRSRKSRSSASPSDMLGNNIRFPTFSRKNTRTLDSPIGSWSKVKSGKKNFLEDNCGAAPAPSSSSPPRRASQRLAHRWAGLAQDIVGILSGTKGTSASQGDPDFRSTLVSSRPPSSEDEGQNDILVEKSHVEDRDHSEKSGKSASMLTENGTNDDGDALIPWTCPTTNSNFFINPRTGMASTTLKGSEGTESGSSPTSGAPDRPSPRKRVKLGNKPNGQVVADPNNWIGRLLRDWNNPIFQQTEEDIPRVLPLEGTGAGTLSILHGHHRLCSQIEIEKAFKESISALPERLSKGGLQDAEVIAQVDKKFILAKVAASAERQGVEGDATERDLLIVIDQHAADERYRIEELLRELCTPPSPEQQGFRSILGLAPRVAAVALPKPMTFHISSREHRLFKIHAKHFADWGILYDLPSPTALSRIESESRYDVVVKTLPPGIAGRCKSEAKLMLELLRGEVWRLAEGDGVGSARESKEEDHVPEGGRGVDE
ncbi:hypothetical protein GP486_007311, partial [Trichoglossum hirsutum]